MARVKIPRAFVISRLGGPSLWGIGPSVHYPATRGGRRMRLEDFGIPMRRTCHCVSQWCMHHQALRAQWQIVVSADRADCWRCGEHITPDQLWDLGHDDRDKALYRGPECRPCNRATSGRRQQRERRWVL